MLHVGQRRLHMYIQDEVIRWYETQIGQIWVVYWNEYFGGFNVIFYFVKLFAENVDKEIIILTHKDSIYAPKWPFFKKIANVFLPK
jgi:hypothetical protein